MYDVQAITYPWFGGDGFLYGKPVIRLNLRKTKQSRKLNAHAIAQRIHSASNMDTAGAARWVAITGDTEQADNTLKLVLGSTIGKLTYIESHGAKSMCDSTGHLPIWDHVCLRVKMPDDPTKIQFFHSVVVCGKPSIEDVSRFNLILDKMMYNGERYVQHNAHGRVIAKNFADTYRLTQPIG